MILQGLWQAIENWPLSQYIASSEFAFPTLESVHVMAIVTVLGTIAVVDLRLLGLASKESRVTDLTKDTLPWTWGAFVIAMITGSLLFISKATTYMVNPFFLWKMVLIALAGVNMLVFHFVTWHDVKTWDASPTIPKAAKLAGGLSIGIWLVVVFVARAIGFTLDKYSQN
jgi:hypothetical protein